MTHRELCKLTAERFSNKCYVTLYEYQSFASNEFPDVLVFNGITTLYEIKINKSDFLADSKKESRKEYKVKGFLDFDWVKRHWIQLKNLTFAEINWKNLNLDNWIIQYPHLGRKRYYVCPKGLIDPEEINNGFGLYWYNGRFSLKKESQIFKNDIFTESNILQHAFRKYGNGNKENIIIGKYQN